MPKSRLLSAPGGYLIFGALVLFVAASVAGAYPGGRVRLAAADMSLSRGNDFEDILYSCSANANYPACTPATVGNDCKTCGPGLTQNGYHDAGADGDAIFEATAGAVFCGTTYTGRCALQFGFIPYCNTTVNTQVNCPQPKGPPPNEP